MGLERDGESLVGKERWVDAPGEVAKFPRANRRGVLDYHRTFKISGQVAAKLGQLHVVVHGEDLNVSGSYDTFMEASLPVACGGIDPA